MDGFTKADHCPLMPGFGKCWLRDKEMYCRYIKRPANELHADFTYTICMTNAFKGFVV